MRLRSFDVEVDSFSYSSAFLIFLECDQPCILRLVKSRSVLFGDVWF